MLVDQPEVRAVAVGVKYARRLPAVHRQAHPVYVAVVRRDEEQARAGDIFGGGDPGRRAVRQDAADVSLAVAVGAEAGPDHRRVDRARTERVGPDLSIRVGHGQRLGEAHHAVLGGGVQRVAGTPDQATVRRHVQYGPAIRVLQQVRYRVLAPEKDALEVDRDDAVELLLRGVGDRLGQRDAGVVEHDVQLPVPPDRALDQASHVNAGGDVRR